MCKYFIKNFGCGKSRDLYFHGYDTIRRLIGADKTLGKVAAIKYPFWCYTQYVMYLKREFFPPRPDLFVLRKIYFGGESDFVCLWLSSRIFPLAFIFWTELWNMSSKTKVGFFFSPFFVFVQFWPKKNPPFSSIRLTDSSFLSNFDR